MKKLYLECNSGISGDMTVAALLDLGADEEVLARALSGIKEGGFSYEISRVTKNGIDCCDFKVILDEVHATHDADMEYLYGEEPHEHEHHHHHEHEHRNLKEVTAIIEGLDMTDSARALALKIFGILAKAESKAHNTAVEKVHFHEVGALDSIADIVAAAVCFDNLGISEVIIPGISEGKGNVRTQHGLLPIPVPAVTNIAADHKLPLVIKDMEGEYITPTGAAFAAAVMTGRVLPETMTIVKTGLGAGKRKHKLPGILRAILFEDLEEESDYIIKLECNIDDSTGEMLGYTMERLMEAGARDVFHTPIYMKKNRPAYLLSVITDEEHVREMEDIIFAETTTIGIRKQKMERHILPRRQMEIKTPYGSVNVKICKHGDEEECHPEYESVRVISRAKHIPFRVVYGAAIEAWYNQNRQN